MNCHGKSVSSFSPRMMHQRRGRRSSPCVTASMAITSKINNSLLMLIMTMLYMSLVVLVADASSTSKDILISPIRHLEPSLEASQAHSTLVAVSTTKGNVAVVLLTRQSSSLDKFDHDDVGSSSTTTTTTAHVKGEKYGIPIMQQSPQSQTQTSMYTWTRLGSSCMMGMTGFLPDILHLTKYMSKSHDSLVQLYNQPSPSSPFKLISILSQKLDRSTRDEGSRPYGVQVLCIMAEEVRNKNRKDEGSGSGELKDTSNVVLSLVTLDPAGVWRHHAKGRAVVGRYANIIRPLLWGIKSETSLVDTQQDDNGESLSTSPKVIDDASQALKVAMKAMLQGRLNAGIKTTTTPTSTGSTAEMNDNNKLIYEAHLVWTDGKRRQCQTAQIHPLAVHSCRKECLEELLLKNKQ